MDEDLQHGHAPAIWCGRSHVMSKVLGGEVGHWGRIRSGGGEGTRITSTFPSTESRFGFPDVLLKQDGEAAHEHVCCHSPRSLWPQEQNRLVWVLCNQAGRAVTHLCGPLKPLIVTSLLTGEGKSSSAELVSGKRRGCQEETRHPRVSIGAVSLSRHLHGGGFNLIPDHETYLLCVLASWSFFFSPQQRHQLVPGAT